MNVKQIGRFAIDSLYIRERPDEIADVLCYMRAVVVRCEQMFTRNVLEYEAISPLFQEIEDVEMIPTYDLEITKEEDGTLSVKAKKRQWMLKKEV